MPSSPDFPSPTPVVSAAVPKTSFLGAYGRQGAFTDCYETTLPCDVSLPALIEAFYTTRLFKLERWLLAQALRLKSTDEQAAALAGSRTDRFSAWKVEQRSATEILLDAGQTRSWLCVRPRDGASPATTLFFGSAVIPMRPDGGFGVAFHALLGFHQLYSRLLLKAAARRVHTLSASKGL